jgi:hypothetical protein
MAIINLFSKRQKIARGQVPDVYTYTVLPAPLRTQIIHILRDTLGNEGQYSRTYPLVFTAYEGIVEALCREYGLFKLPGTPGNDRRSYILELFTFLLTETDIEKILDAVELSFRAIDAETREINYLGRYHAVEIAEKAIEELNGRFKEHGIGFYYSNGEIIRIDSEFVHTEVIKPALMLLNHKDLLGVQQEFLKAHEHYRLGKNSKEALNECLKAFESMMKAICDKRHWKYREGAAAKELIQICFDKGLIPAFWEAQFTALRSLLESSVPTGRNKLGGHGQGAKPIKVPDYLVSYMLHMTASAIVFLGEAEKALP